jgi:4a-hydroxytetrahydrobiopterin dehydratase
LTRPERLDDTSVATWLRSHQNWQLVDAHLVREIRTTDYPSAVRILEAQVETAQRMDHHPDVTVGYCRLRFELWTHDRAGLTQLDLDYANALDEIVSARFADVVVT